MKQTERKALQDFMNKYGELRKEQDRIFKELQEENRKVNGNAWCCAKTNYEELKELGIKWAESYYEEYVKLTGKLDLISEYGSMLAELNFWKN